MGIGIPYIHVKRGGGRGHAHAIREVLPNRMAGYFRGSTRGVTQQVFRPSGFPKVNTTFRSLRMDLESWGWTRLEGLDRGDGGQDLLANGMERMPS